jgi:hypothetical protein
MKITALVVILVGLLLGSYGFAEGVEWVECDRTDSDLLFYDRESISHPSPNITGVWGKHVLRSEAARQKTIAELTKTDPKTDYSTYSHTLVLFEINCDTGKGRLLSLKHHGSQGTVLISHNDPEAEWNQIPPGAPIDHLYKAVCTKKGKK